MIIFTSSLASCGDTKTVGETYTDTSGSQPNFIIQISSDASSTNFSESVSASSDSQGNTVVYRTKTPANLLSCAAGSSLVDGTGDISSCSKLGLSLHNEGLLNPLTSTELTKSGASVGTPTNGFVYSYFFYNATVCNHTINATDCDQGSDVVSGSPVGATNRCVKIWAAQVKDGVLIAKGGTPAQAVNLATLKCFGF
ncbi:MAG: hypothetical protein JWQ35_2203 [Bacteriovoracaceae bacterium]|nr:hypothetical protein [Bacteriovoracaceae bacterium]